VQKFSQQKSFIGFAAIAQKAAVKAIGLIFKKFATEKQKF